MPKRATPINLCPTIEAEMKKTVKDSSIAVFKRQLRCLGLTDISEATLKGNIASILNEEILSQYSNPKIYVNALLNCYKCVKYDEDEMSYLKQQFEKYAIKSDTHNENRKSRRVT